MLREEPHGELAQRNKPKLATSALKTQAQLRIVMLVLLKEKLAKNSEEDGEHADMLSEESSDHSQKVITSALSPQLILDQPNQLLFQLESLRSSERELPSLRLRSIRSTTTSPSYKDNSQLFQNHKDQQSSERLPF